MHLTFDCPLVIMVSLKLIGHFRMWLILKEIPPLRNPRIGPHHLMSFAPIIAYHVVEIHSYFRLISVHFTYFKPYRPHPNLSLYLANLFVFIREGISHFDE